MAETGARAFTFTYTGQNGEVTEYNIDYYELLQDMTRLEGNVDDRQPVPTLCKRLFGKLIADRGHISQPLLDKLLLRKRAIIESVVDQLKNISQIEHTRHRSPMNRFINIIAGLIAYCYQSKNPSLNLSPTRLLST